MLQIKKPDGCIVIEQHELPDKLLPLKLRDLNSIGHSHVLPPEQRNIAGAKRYCTGCYKKPLCACAAMNC